MPQLLERPQFYEGQILSADDLTQMLDYGRAGLARHERGLHLWGIAHGLKVEKRASDQALVVRPGMAVDSSGAQLIVSEDLKLDAADLKSDVAISDKDHEQYFPVFLVGRRNALASAGVLGACATGGAARVIDSVEVTYRRFALGWDQEPAIDPATGPDDSPQSSRLVLLGFARYKHSTVPGESVLDDFQLERDGLRPRFAGVRASTVEASGGKLFLRSQPGGTPGAPVVILDQADADKAFVFGLDNGAGGIDNPLVTADSKGNLTVAGTLKGALTTGKTLVQSGIATDGMRLPLPTGVTQEQVDGGKVALHISVTPRMDALVPPASGPTARNWVPIAQCSVDSSRRVSCAVRWVNVTTASAVERYRRGACDYLIIANVSS